MSRTDKHETAVWQRVSEGSERAECTCGWRGPKRTTIGGIAPADARRHLDSIAASPPAGEQP